MTDPREDKLPKWARSLLARERLRADGAEQKLAEHLKTVEPTPIWYGSYDSPIYVPADYGYQTVHFSVTGEPTGRSYEQISVSFRKGAIEIQGGRSVALNPIASNTVEIGLRD